MEPEVICFEIFLLFLIQVFSAIKLPRTALALTDKLRHIKIFKVTNISSHGGIQLKVVRSFASTGAGRAFIEQMH